MSYLIAITGKGGVGKTTVAGIIVRQLLKSGRSPVLAVDADPNSCLDQALGVKAEKTVGRVREEAKSEVPGMSGGIAKQDLLRLKIAESLVEARGFDLIAMGRPEGAGCYCYANNVLKSVIQEISGQYPYVVLDNEAGLENLSRRIVQRVDMLILVSDASNAGLGTLSRLYELAKEMGIQYGKLLLVVNRLRGGLPQKAGDIKAKTGADGLIGLPDDAEVASFMEEGKPVLGLPDDNPVVKKIHELLAKIE